MVFNVTFNYFRNIVEVSFIGEGNWSTEKKKNTDIDNLYQIMLDRVLLAMSGIRTHNCSGDMH